VGSPALPECFFVPALSEGNTVVLGELCARVDATVSPSDRCVVIGWRMGVDGRKHIAGTAVFAESGRVVAMGRATWIEVSASAFPDQRHGANS
jgi:hypothetical protein